MAEKKYYQGKGWDFLRNVAEISFNIGFVGFNVNMQYEHDVARKLLIYLEDRRVLYIAQNLEIPRACIESIRRIREMLTSELPNTQEGGMLQNEMQKMRATCTSFLTSHENQFPEYFHLPHEDSFTEDELMFVYDLVNLRNAFALSIRKIAKTFNLEVRKDLQDAIHNLIERD